MVNETLDNRLIEKLSVQELGNVQGVHKVRVHFKKIITLIVFAIEIICKKDLKEENRYFLRFY